MTILEAASLLRQRKISSLELTSNALAQISKWNPAFNAFITVTEALARNQAARADEELARGTDRGPLHGIPIALKDVFSTKGIRTTAGSKIYEDYVPDHDSAVTEKLEAAGAVLLGKTGMHELAYGITSNNPHFGAVRNPWNPECVPGGSSGGSGAAVASEMVFMAMGTDTGGSVRIPASYCGVVGLKPTSGRVSRYGVLPLDFSLDHMGPITRSVRDAGVVLNAIAGYDSRDDTSSREQVKDYVTKAPVSLDGMRIGLPENFFFDRVDPAVESAVKEMARVAEKSGAVIVPVRVPDINALNVVSRVILLAEASALMEQHLDQREKFGADVLSLLDQGRLIRAADYVNAQRLRRVFRKEFTHLFRDLDALLTPAAKIGAPKIGQLSVRIGDRDEDTRLASTQLVRGMNVTGNPALAMPCGFNGDGLPLGLQIIGRPYGEDTILRIGAALEDSTDFHLKRPTGI